MEQKSLAVFDLDHTLIYGNSSFIFGLYLTKRRFFSLWTPIQLLYYRFLFRCHCITLDVLHQKMHQKFLKGRSIHTLSSYAQKCVEQHLLKRVNKQVLRELQQCQKAGQETLLLSSSPQFLIEPIGKVLGFSFCEGTRYAFDSKGKIAKVSHIMNGLAKWKFVEKLPFLAKYVTVYTDSSEDLPLLQNVGTPIVVNPDKKLFSYAKSHNWQILK